MAAEVDLRTELHRLTQRLAALRVRHRREVEAVTSQLDHRLQDAVSDGLSAQETASNRLQSVLAVYQTEKLTSEALLTELLALKQKNGEEIRYFQTNLRKTREETHFLRLHLTEKLQNDRNRLEIDTKTRQKSLNSQISELQTDQIRQKQALESHFHSLKSKFDQINSENALLRSELSHVISQNSRKVTSLSDTLRTLEGIIGKQERELREIEKLRGKIVKKVDSLKSFSHKMQRKVGSLESENRLLRSKSVHLGKIIYKVREFRGN